MKNTSIISFFIPHQGCTSNCIFCNQKAITGQRTSLDVKSVVSTIEEYLSTIASPSEVAFYGGSFTALSSNLQELYLSCVQ
ncbi:MAG: radical SAM protein, partial [Syntrophomonadaceae bacterium]|nr:radical SAM protein [Syntrophomonadaceae bacterium]